MNAPLVAHEPGTAAVVLASAARAVSQVLEAGASAEDALSPYAQAPQRAAIQAVTMGTLRWYLRLAPAVLPLLAKPAAKTDPHLRALLCCAVHQLEYSAHAKPTTVAAAVDAARLLDLGKASGLVNAVLRRFLRERESALAAVDGQWFVRHAHPQWLAAALQRAWPEDHTAILEANNAHPPLVVRVDTGRLAVADFIAQLAAKNLSAAALPEVPTAVRLDSPVSVAQLPGFAEGLVSVQDASAQFAAQLLAPRANERVLDACAAPGGKTGALLEMADGPIDLIAVDHDAQRLSLVTDNLRRLGRQARVVQADLRRPLGGCDGLHARALADGGLSFDAILLDAPCSGTGVIRRHPDIKLLRRATDIRAFAATQLELLQGCWSLLRPGGRLLYVTCSVLPAENAEVIAQFLGKEATAREQPLPTGPQRTPPLKPCRHGWQMLPGAGGDGFYYAYLTKNL